MYCHHSSSLLIAEPAWKKLDISSSNYVVTYGCTYQDRRNQRQGGGERPHNFGRYLNPILIGGADIAHHITTPHGIEDIPTDGPEYGGE